MCCKTVLTQRLKHNINQFCNILNCIWVINRHNRILTERLALPLGRNRPAKKVYRNPYCSLLINKPAQYYTALPSGVTAKSQTCTKKNQVTNGSAQHCIIRLPFCYFHSLFIHMAPYSVMPLWSWIYIKKKNIKCNSNDKVIGVCNKFFI